MRQFSRVYWTWIICTGSGTLLLAAGTLLFTAGMVRSFGEIATTTEPLPPSNVAEGISLAMPSLVLMPVGGSVALIGFVAWVKLFYRSWSLIRSEHMKVTPLTALLLLLVPLFNLYWMFAVIIRLATGLNGVAARRGVQASRVPVFLGVTSCVLAILTLCLGGLNLSPYSYLAMISVSSVTIAIFFYCVQRTSGQLAIADEQPVVAARS